MTENIEDNGEGVKNGEKSERGFAKRVLKKETVVFIIALISLVLMGMNAGKIERWIGSWRAERYDQAVQRYIDEAKKIPQK